MGRRVDWSLDVIRGIVISEPERLSEASVSGSGYVGSFHSNGNTYTTGSMSFDTSHRRGSVFWAKAEDGVDCQFVLRDEHPPVLKGHRIGVIIASSGRRSVIAGIVNCNSRSETTVLSAKEVLQSLDLPLGTRWVERIPVPPGTYRARLRRWQVTRYKLFASIGVFVSFALLGAITVSAAVAFGVVCLTTAGVAGVTAFVILSNAEERPSRHEEVERSHSYVRQFEDDYDDFVADVKAWDAKRLPPTPIAFPPRRP